MPVRLEVVCDALSSLSPGMHISHEEALRGAAAVPTPATPSRRIQNAEQPFAISDSLEDAARVKLVVPDDDEISRNGPACVVVRISSVVGGPADVWPPVPEL
eukprot:351643-Pleurochrysis_carterae.AAC.3